jgi:hypothetical protein
MFRHSGLSRDLVIIRLAMISGTSAKGLSFAIEGLSFAIVGIMAFAPWS